MTQNLTIDPLLIQKYNQPTPRYTSYPTVPFWKDEIDLHSWQKAFTQRFLAQNATNGISIYVHLPFCETLCTYCGCNKKITSNHTVEEEYLEAIENEWKCYRKIMGQTPIIREIHLGGGTPTFFSALNLRRLINCLIKNSIVHPHYEFNLEGHPNNTTRQQMDVLFSLGFRRISYGVQDLDPKVQNAINRIQPFESVQAATENARAAGFTSVNFDLIYGLPFQTIQSIEKTIDSIMRLQPDRIAFYSYAHLPWTSRGQRLFNELDLPSAVEKILLYKTGMELLLRNGYIDIGMDHFALPHDQLVIAKQNGRLHRNFMGYTTQNSGMLIGLGVSAISDLGDAFAQNDKTLANYYASVQKDKLPVKRGFFLSEEDILFREHIKNIACGGRTSFNKAQLPLLEAYCFPVLADLAIDGLVEYNQHGVSLTDTGHYFIRNVCSAFDLYMRRQANLPHWRAFSKAI